jgi:hypothetical protein
MKSAFSAFTVIKMFNKLQIAAVDYLEKRTAKIKEKEAARLEGF